MLKSYLRISAGTCKLEDLPLFAQKRRKKSQKKNTNYFFLNTKEKFQILGKKKKTHMYKENVMSIRQMVKEQIQSLLTWTPNERWLPTAKWSREESSTKGGPAMCQEGVGGDAGDPRHWYLPRTRPARHAPDVSLQWVLPTISWLCYSVVPTAEVEKLRFTELKALAPSQFQLVAQLGFQLRLGRGMLVGISIGTIWVSMEK